MGKHSFKQVWRYRFDNFMARGGSSIFVSLTVLFTGLLIIISVLRAAMAAMLPDVPAPEGHSAMQIIFLTFLQLTDPGNIGEDTGSSPVFKFWGITAGLSGVVMLSALVAFITTALDRKLNDLKKGHSKVIEEGHTVILGWKEQRIIEILRELLVANESQDNPCVVILADVDKEMMDDYLALRMPDTQNTRIVTRSGNPSSPINLEIVSVAECKSVIVLADCNEEASEEEKTNSDARAIKTVLALVAARPADHKLAIIAEVFHERNRQVISDISPEEVCTIDGRDILAKILVQTSRSVGLSVVYSELFSFVGNEMYFYHAPWGSVRFGDLAWRFVDGVPMGLYRANNMIVMNPRADTPIQPDDQIIILADDDSAIQYQYAPLIQPGPFRPSTARNEKVVEHELILGWTPKSEIILSQYADYLLEGSSISIMIHQPSAEVQAEFAQLKASLPGIHLRMFDADPLRADALLAAQPFRYDNIILLSHSDGDSERADSQTIILLLNLRKIFREHGGPNVRTKLITEVLDSQNQGLISRAGVNDFIISNRCVSMLLAQISENPMIKRVYDDLFQEDGAEVYLKRASLYFADLPSPVTFADMMGMAFRRGETCFGVKIKALEQDAERNFGVQLNPPKGTTYHLTADDYLVVLAEDET